MVVQRSPDRRELSEFLRTRRARVAPDAVGLKPGSRRRATGLRREEVAYLAGVGLTWYTWFEQGREIQVSTHFLENLARALRLNETERAHLFALAQHRAPPLDPFATAPLSSLLQRVLDAHPYPAYVRTARWDVVGWNRAAAFMFGDYAQLPPAERNIVWLVFTSASYRRLMLDWEPDARRILARFRVDFGRSGGIASTDDLVGSLERASDCFRKWWHEHDVRGDGEGIRRFYHEEMGEIEFEHVAFAVDGAECLKMVAYTPRPGINAEKARELFASIGSISRSLPDAGTGYR